MSSGEEDINSSEQVGQENGKRRVQRACDTCRRKKIRCNGAQIPNNRCSNCTAFNLDCTYEESAKKRRGRPKGYVESLENRLESMNKLLKKLCPNTDFTQEVGVRIDRNSWVNDDRVWDFSTSRGSRQGPSRSRLTTFALSTTGVPRPIDPDDLTPSDDEATALTGVLKRTALGPLDRHFHGKSSGVVLVQAAVNLKQEFSGSNGPKDLLVPPTRRAELWSPHPWEVISEEQVVQYYYPPDDLIPQLVEYYFTCFNPFVPILHRPSFERALTDHCHHNDIGFGSVVMLVCAIGARWSDDPRCCMEGTTSKHSAGWKWFDQVQVNRRTFMSLPRLYDLQIYALSSLFLLSSSPLQSSWTMAGIGIRLAQEVGAHRRKVYNALLSVESELWKRAFWVLVALDRFGSAALGRPCAIQDEDFDLDLPLEVDDEYWEHPDPTKAFKQPPGVPSVLSFFNSFLKLNQIQAFAVRTIYSINKSKILLGFAGPQWEQHIVAELDSALNKWIDTVPDHLRWDPHCENLLHFNQSATLYATYYQLQILIHRPFIPSPRKPSPLTFPSLVICASAARSCSHVADICRRRSTYSLPHIQTAVFTAGVVLLLNIWGTKKSGTFIDSKQQMSDVHKCMQVLRSIEDHFITAGRLWDVLNGLACAGDIPVEKRTPSPSNKGECGQGSSIASNTSPVLIQLPASTAADGTRPIAGQSLGMVSGNLGAAQTPSSSGSSPVAGAGGRPYDTEQLARANPALGVQGAEDGLGLSWMGAGPSDPLGGQTQGAGQPSMFAANVMPNLNIFETFQSDPQMFNVIEQGGFASRMDGMPGAGRNGVSTRAENGTAYGEALPGPVDGLPGGYGELVGTLPSMDEALQMWSTAPMSFDLEDWDSYLCNFGGAESSIQESSPPSHT